jgi:raffinose/stachyose/melibiose transport system permease protein
VTATIQPARPVPTRKRTGGTRRTRWGYLPYLAPGLVGFGAIVVIPLVVNIVLSFTRWSGVGDPEFLGLRNYRRLVRDSVFWQSFENSIWFVLAMAIVPTALGLILAAVLFDYIAPRFGQRWSSAFRAGYYLPQVLPVTVAGVVWMWILNPFGVVNSVLETLGMSDPPNWLGEPTWALLSVMVVLVWIQLGYSLVIFMAGLGRVDPQYYEAAEIDGASWFQRFRFITVSQLRPETFVVLLTTTIAALKVFSQVYVLTRGGPGTATMVPSYYSYSNFFGTLDVGYGAAIATVLTLVIMVLAVAFLKVRGVEEGDAR